MKRQIPNAVKENTAYVTYIKNKDPKTNIVRTLLAAFLVGGLICCIGEGFRDTITLIAPTMDKDKVSALVTCILIFIGSLLTGIGVYDDIGKVAGAGSIIPITGFANSVVSPALEFKTEGVVYGVESKMFIIAGPVIVSGILSSALVGIVYYVISLF